MFIFVIISLKKLILKNKVFKSSEIQELSCEA